MKETADSHQNAVAMGLPPEVVQALGETQSAVARRSAIVWGEHCTECTFPVCYSTCNFYTPRWDLHCRRFERGIQRVAIDGRDSLMRIQFRRWGKLEGQGSVALKPVSVVRALEYLDLVSDRLWTGPTSLRRRMAWRWNECKRFLGGAGQALDGRDVFILEAWHDGEDAWPFTFSVMPRRKSEAGLFQTAIELPPGYNRVVIPARRIAATVALSQPLTIQVEPMREGAPAIVFGMVDFARLSRPLPDRGGRRSPAKTGLPKFKCAVWDLDNTLWQGVLVEDGIDGVTLSSTAAGLVRELDRRGIVNSIVSKNDPELALAALERFGLREYFVFPKIGWGPKSENLKSVIAEMDIGADTFAFIDDQAFERGEIAELLPEVTVFSDADLPGLLEDPRFDVPATAESAKRRRMYQTEERRVQARESSGMDYAAFLRSCCIALAIQPLTAQNSARIYELSQRTNQLNFSGRRYSRDELERVIAERPRDAFVLSCEDKFGDYGVIGFCLLSGGRIESFFMSCRVQRKRVENAFFQFLATELTARGIRRLEISYRKTEKNHASVEMLEQLGFAYVQESDDEGLFVADLPRDFADGGVVQVRLSPIPAKTSAVA